MENEWINVYSCTRTGSEQLFEELLHIPSTHQIVRASVIEMNQGSESFRLAILDIQVGDTLYQIQVKPIHEGINPGSIPKMHFQVLVQSATNPKFQVLEPKNEIYPELLNTFDYLIANFDEFYELLYGNTVNWINLSNLAFPKSYLPFTLMTENGPGDTVITGVVYPRDNRSNLGVIQVVYDGSTYQMQVRRYGEESGILYDDVKKYRRISEGCYLDLSLHPDKLPAKVNIIFEEFLSNEPFMGAINTYYKAEERIGMQGLFSMN